VTVLCPGPVRTNIKASSRNRPKDLGPGGLADVDLETSDLGSRFRWIEPEDVGAIVLTAMSRGDLYAFTHPEQFDVIEQRFRKIIQAGRAGASS
jgi:hypothetical protein